MCLRCLEKVNSILPNDLPWYKVKTILKHIQVGRGTFLFWEKRPMFLGPLAGII